MADRAVVEDQAGRERSARLVADGREREVGPSRRSPGTPAARSRGRSRRPIRPPSVGPEPRPSSLRAAATTVRPAGRPAERDPRRAGADEVLAVLADPGGRQARRSEGTRRPWAARPARRWRGPATTLRGRSCRWRRRSSAVRVWPARSPRGSKEVALARVVAVAGERGVVQAGGFVPEAQARPVVEVSVTESIGVVGERLASVRWTSWKPSGPTAGPARRRPGRPGRSSRASRRPGHPQVRVGRPAGHPDGVGRAVVVPHRDRVGPAGLDLVGGPEEVGRRSSPGPGRRRPRARRRPGTASRRRRGPGCRPRRATLPAGRPSRATWMSWTPSAPASDDGPTRSCWSWPIHRADRPDRRARPSRARITGRNTRPRDRCVVMGVSA